MAVVFPEVFVETVMAEFESLLERCKKVDLEATLGSIPGSVRHLGSVFLIVSKVQSILAGQRQASDRLEASKSVLVSAPDLDDRIDAVSKVCFLPDSYVENYRVFDECEANLNEIQFLSNYRKGYPNASL